MKKKLFGIFLVVLMVVFVMTPKVTYASETGTVNSEVTEIVSIEDEAPPLGILNDRQKMTWWWLVIVVAVSTAGAELIRRHQFSKSDDDVNKY